MEKNQKPPADQVDRSARINARLKAAQDARRHALLYPRTGPAYLRGDDLRH